jgi:hypothetical protein
MPEPSNINASVITEPLDKLLTALAFKIEREWPAHLQHIQGGRELFLLTLRTADVTYRSIRWLSAEVPPNPDRKLEYCLSSPPLNRTILDNLFTVLFILEDLPSRCVWYYKAAWREQRTELRRYQQEFGHLPEWRDWLSRMQAHTDSGIHFLGIAPQEVADPYSISRWPNADRMVKYRLPANAPVPPIRAFMGYLNDWFYADLSQQAHLGGAGLMKRSAALLFDRNNPEREAALKKNRYVWLGQTITLMLALASELEVYFRFGLRDRLRYIWGVTAPVIVVTKEVYDKRYSALLEEAAKHHS